jgi:hypothetical protein
MKHLRNSLVVFAAVLAGTGVVTFLIPSHTRGSSNDVPKSAFSIRGASAQDFIVSGPDSEGTSYAITSLTVVNDNSVPAGRILHGLWSSTSDCLNFSGSLGSVLGPEVKVPAGETVHLSFQQPFILSAQPGAASCLRLESTNLGDPPVHYMVVGYRF